MASEERQIRFLVRLDDVIAPVHGGLKALMLLVGDILGRTPTVAEVSEEVSRVFFGFDPSPGLRPSRAELTTYVEQRVLHWAMSDAVELVKPLINRSRAVCVLYDRDASSSITGDQWKTMQESWKRTDEKLSRMGLDQRFKEFSRQHPDFQMPLLLPEIQGILRMRNCLLHNSGVVARSYCNERENQPERLRIRFRRWLAWVLDPAGDREYNEGEILRSGQSLQVRFVAAERAWQVGEQIVLSPQLFVDLCVTIDRFAIEMAKALEVYGRFKGIPSEPVSSDAGRADGLSSPRMRSSR